MILFQRKDSIIQDVSDTIVKAMEKYYLSMKIQVKFGVYQIEDKDIPVISMADRAILAVNEAKGTFDAVVSYYDDSVRERMLLEQTITNEMTNALEEEQFEVYLQGKYDLVTERIAGAEALVRWIHPTMGFMAPNDFIPIFEKNGFITHLDMYVWDKTCGIIESWLKTGGRYVPVSVNVSRKDIYNENLPQILMGIIEKHGLKPYHLHLEITETVYTENPKQLIEVVKELKDMGFIIEMDDFGSGYSSLNMLSELPIDILKLDIKFLSGEEGSQSNTKSIMNFVFSLAKWMNLPVVSEGVETQAQVDMLKGLNCNYVQGYFFCRPVPNEEFTKLLMNSEISYLDDPYNFESSLGELIIGPHVSDRVMMIVDDMKMNRAILKEYFEDNFSIVEAGDGEVAWKYISEHSDNIAIVMLDLIMPRVSGYKLMEYMKNDPSCRNIPVIVTSQAGETEEAKSLSQGAADYIAKPYSREVAIHRVNKVLTYRKLLNDSSKTASEACM